MVAKSPLSAKAAYLFAFAAIAFSHVDTSQRYIGKLATLLCTPPELEILQPVVEALKELLEVISPEDEEVMPLCQSIFALLNHAGEVENTVEYVHTVSSLVVQVIETIAPYEFENKDEVLGQFAAILITTGGTEGCQADAFACWIDLSTNLGMMVAQCAEHILPQVIQTINTPELEENAYINAASLLKIFAQFEANNSEEFEMLTPNAIDLIASLARISANNLDDSEWNSGVASLDAIHDLLVLLTDEAILPTIELVKTLVADQSESARATGVAILKSIIRVVDDPSFVTQLPLLNFINDPCPFVRAKGISAITWAIHRLTDVNPQQALATSSQIMAVVNHLADEPLVAYKTIDLISALVRIPGFTETTRVFAAAFERSLLQLPKNPFPSIATIIMQGDKAAIWAYFPTIISAFQTVLGQGQFPLLHELYSLIQAYCLRFGPDMKGIMNPLVELLSSSAIPANEYASDAVNTLGCLAQTVQLEIMPHLQPIVNMINVFLNNTEDSDSVSNAAQAFSAIISIKGLDYHPFAEMLLAGLAKNLINVNLPTSALINVIQAVADLALVAPDVFGPHIVAIMGHIESYAIGLPIVALDDEDDENPMLMANAIGIVTLKAMQLTPPEVAEGFVKTALKVYVFAAQCPHIITRLANSAINIALFIAQKFPAYLNGILQESEEFLVFLVNMAGDEEDDNEMMKDVRSTAKQVLQIIGFNPNAPQQ